MSSLAAPASTLLLLADLNASDHLAAALAKAAPELDLLHVQNRQQVPGYPLPDVIVMDLDMALESAFDLLTWARSQPAYSKIPVIGLTSRGQSHADRAYALGANCCLQKPDAAGQMDGIAQGISAYASLLVGR